MRDIIEISPEWLVELAPHFYKSSDILPEETKEKKKVKLPIKLIKK